MRVSVLFLSCLLVACYAQTAPTSQLKHTSHTLDLPVSDNNVDVDASVPSVALVNSGADGDTDADDAVLDDKESDIDAVSIRVKGRKRGGRGRGKNGKRNRGGRRNRRRGVDKFPKFCTCKRAHGPPGVCYDFIGRRRSRRCKGRTCTPKYECVSVAHRNGRRRRTPKGHNVCIKRVSTRKVVPLKRRRFHGKNRFCRWVKTPSMVFYVPYVGELH